jgi:uncharacterized protein YPO0396
MAPNNSEYMTKYMKEYQKKTRLCDSCGKDIKLPGWYKHVTTKKHLKNEKSKTEKKEESSKKLEDSNEELKKLNEKMNMIMEMIKTK